MGADMEGEDEASYPTGRSFSSETGGYVPRTIQGGEDVMAMPIAIGYEKIS